VNFDERMMMNEDNDDIKRLKLREISVGF